METEEPGVAEWYCVRTKSKSEHIAAAHLKNLEGVEVFCPRIRFQKSTRRGRVWFKEAMFPGYLLVRFELKSALRMVGSAHAVTRVVRFGDNYPVVEGEMVTQLREAMNAEEIVTVENRVEAGDEVEVAAGPLCGMKAVVTMLLPAKERVRILLEFLGNAREVEVPEESLLTPKKVRLFALS